MGDPEPAPAFQVEEVADTPHKSPLKKEEEKPKRTPKKSPAKKKEKEKEAAEPEVNIFDHGSFDPRGKSVTSGKAITGWI